MTALLGDNRSVEPKPVIDILIVTYNSKRYIGRCVRSLRRHVPGCRIHIVDNASTDGTRKILPRLKPDSLKLNDENRYLSPVWNEFLQESDAEFVLLVNPDVEVMSGVCVERALSAMREDPKVVAAGHVVEQAYNDLLKWKPPVRPEDRGIFQKVVEATMPTAAVREEFSMRSFSGSFVLLRRVDTLALGGFADELPLYYNDTELSLRILRHGRRMASVWQPEEQIVRHLGEGSSRDHPGLRLRAFRLRRKLFSRIATAVMGRPADSRRPAGSDE